MATLTINTRRFRVRDGQPALNVKDTTLWAYDQRTAKLIAELGEEVAQSCYESAAWNFWNNDVEHVAEEHGFDRSNVYQDGRSGGWLVLRGTTFLEYVIPEDFDNLTIPEADDTADDWTRDEYASAIAERDRFLAFVKDIEGALKYAADFYVEELEDALHTLEANREANTIRGEN